MKKKLNLCETKTWAFLYPLYAREFLFGNNYEAFAELLQKDWDLTEKQWECILIEWEFKEKLLS